MKPSLFPPFLLTQTSTEVLALHILMYGLTPQDNCSFYLCEEYSCWKTKTRKKKKHSNNQSQALSALGLIHKPGHMTKWQVTFFRHDTTEDLRVGSKQTFQGSEKIPTFQAEEPCLNRNIRQMLNSFEEVKTFVSKITTLTSHEPSYFNNPPL